MRRIPAPDGLAALYAQVGQSEIARRYGVDRSVVRRWLDEAGIPIKPMARVKRELLATKSHAEKLAMTEASRALIKGRPRSDEWHRKRALGVQRAAKMSYYEGYVFEFTRRILGYDPIPQYAVWKFNIDIAVPEYKFGIEVDGGLWHTRHSPRKAAQDAAKWAYLQPLGWKIFRVRARDRETLQHELQYLGEVLRPYATLITPS